MKRRVYDVPRFWRGCAIIMAFWLAIAIVVAVACRVNAGEQTAVYLPISTHADNTGVAWCSGCPEVAEKLNAHRWYGCCHTCPDANDARIAIMRPGWQWSSICPADHAGYILVGNEDTIPPASMAQFILETRASHPRAHLVCLNHFDVAYMTAVLALLPSGTCYAVGVHPYLIGDTAVSDWLDTIPASRFWITEIGGCHDAPGIYDWLRRVVSEAGHDDRVRMIMAYTAVGGEPECAGMVGEGGNLLANGRAFVDGLTTGAAYP